MVMQLPVSFEFPFEFWKRRRMLVKFAIGRPTVDFDTNIDSTLLPS